MIEYSNIEKQTIIYLLSLIMEADGLIHPNEIEYMDSVIKQLGISHQEYDHLEEADLQTASTLFKQMSKEKQEEVRNMCHTMSQIDGFVDPRETEVINML